MEPKENEFAKERLREFAASACDAYIKSGYKEVSFKVFLMMNKKKLKGYSEICKEVPIKEFMGILKANCDAHNIKWI